MVVNVTILAGDNTCARQIFLPGRVGKGAENIMWIKNVKVYREGKKFEEGQIFIDEEKGVFAEEGNVDKGEVIDGEGCYAVPGLIDIHFHGCKGYDFCDGTIEAIEKIAEYEASVGVTGICPATMTLPAEELEQILSTASEYQKVSHGGADLLGVNMEGPFISEEKKGAQDAKNIRRCDAALFRQFQSAAKGLVKYIGIAPEKEGALDFVEQVKDEVHVSLAHTNADYESAKAAYDKGACHAVHLYNAMPPFSHRAPGVVGAVADSPHVMAELICDGVHIHPAVVRTTFKMLGEERIIFISDSMRATGMPDGRYTLGGLEVDVKGNRATLVSDGALAGSATNLMDCVRTAVKKMDIPLETAIACATENPAKSLGIFDQYGSISTGKKADLLLLDQDLNLKAVIKNGKVL